jgi:tubulin monoglycylase TTLL3/8
LPQIRHLVTESFRAVAYKKIDPLRKNFSFEIFGFDFMIDEDFVVYLIEANTNPSLETNSAILSRIIPVMLDASFRIAIDPILPPPELNFKRAHEALHENKYV